MRSRRFRRRWDIRNQKSAKIESVALSVHPPARPTNFKMLLPSSIVPLSIGMGRVTACALRGCRALSLRSPFSPAQPWAIFFHPPNPPIALQSFTRDAPFSPVAMARRSVRRSVRTRSRTEQVCGAKQRQDHAVSPIAKQEATIWLRSFWRARWASKGSCLAYPFPLSLF
jgi:hypothetical protein